MTFCEISDLWLSAKKLSVKESTACLYGYEIKKYLLPFLGKTDVRCIEQSDIQSFVNFYACRSENPLSSAFVQELVILIKQILDFAVRMKMCEKKELKICYSNIHIKKSGRKVFSESERCKIINSAQNDSTFKSVGILLAICTGMRIGEICALKWSDIDLCRRVIYVNSTIQRITVAAGNTKIIKGSPKSASSIRQIPLSDILYNFLTAMQAEKSSFVLTNSNHPCEPRTYRHFYRNFLAKNKIEFLNFHCLRHTFATTLIEKGVDIKTVSELLGHASVSTTMNLYVHPSFSQKMKAVNLLHN